MRPYALALLLLLPLTVIAAEPPTDEAAADVDTQSETATESEGVSDAAPAAPIATLQTVVVTGIQPGPGLWQVRKGENTLWIMATLNPLPKRMEWEPRELDALVARADRVLAPPRVELDADIGFFGRLSLIPTALRVRNNPDDKTLVDILPPDLYARWEAQKALYLGRDRGVEKRRPFIAANELMDEALDDLDLRRKNIVWERIERVAKRNDREITPVQVKIKLDDPRQALRDFEEGGVDDVDCLRATVQRLETDTIAMQERANAWAVGDLRTLNELNFESELRVCALALLGSEALRSRGFTDLPQRMMAEWTRVAEAAIAEVPTTVAVADFQILTASDGLLAGLRAKGYEIIEPGSEPIEESTEPSEDEAVNN